MNSPTHSLLALALLSKKGQPGRNRAVFIGALLPDIVIYFWAPWQTLVNGNSQRDIWDVLYFEPPMQTLIAIFNSIPIYAAIAVIGYFAMGKKWGAALLFFALAVLIHMATDMPVHGHDAYRHFWPLSDWRFHSPISYWERDLHAGWVSAVEAIIGLTSIVILWRRFPVPWVKIILGMLAALYVIVQVMIRLANFNTPA